MMQEMDEIISRLISDSAFRRRVVRFIAESSGEEGSAASCEGPKSLSLEELVRGTIRLEGSGQRLTRRGLAGDAAAG